MTEAALRAEYEQQIQQVQSMAGRWHPTLNRTLTRADIQRMTSDINRDYNNRLEALREAGRLSPMAGRGAEAPFGTTPRSREDRIRSNLALLGDVQRGLRDLGVSGAEGAGGLGGLGGAAVPVTDRAYQDLRQRILDMPNAGGSLQLMDPTGQMQTIPVGGNIGTMGRIGDVIATPWRALGEMFGAQSQESIQNRLQEEIRQHNARMQQNQLQRSQSLNLAQQIMSGGEINIPGFGNLGGGEGGKKPTTSEPAPAAPAPVPAPVQAPAAPAAKIAQPPQAQPPIANAGIPQAPRARDFFAEV